MGVVRRLWRGGDNGGFGFLCYKRMVKPAAGRAEKRRTYSRDKELESESEEEEIGECELAMCCVAGLVLLLAGAIVVVAVTPGHKPKVYPATQFKSNVKTISSSEVKPFSSHFVKDALLSQDMLRSRIRDCTSFTAKAGKGETNRPAALDLLVVVHSSPDSNSAARDKVRITWKKNVPDGVEVVFVIPLSGKPKSKLEELKRECAHYNDMVLFYDGVAVPESEFVLLQLAWASQKQVSFYYLLKTRDYMYIHLPRVMSDLIQQLKQTKSNAYLGYFRGDIRVKNRAVKKPPEPNYFLCDKYIRFAHSNGYVLSSELVHRLHSVATYLSPYNNEDVAVATWLSPYQDVDWRHDIRFNTELEHNRGCKNNWLVFPSSDILVQHRVLENSGKICSHEWLGFRTYLYNFDVPPSNCCTTLHFT